MEYMNEAEVLTDIAEAMVCREPLNRFQQQRLESWAEGPLDPNEDLIDRETREMVEGFTESDDVDTIGRAAKALVNA